MNVLAKLHARIPPDVACYSAVNGSRACFGGRDRSSTRSASRSQICLQCAAFMQTGFAPPGLPKTTCKQWQGQCGRALKPPGVQLCLCHRRPTELQEAATAANSLLPDFQGSERLSGEGPAPFAAEGPGEESKDAFAAESQPPSALLCALRAALRARAPESTARAQRPGVPRYRFKI